jgi:hypothetical protein
VSGSIWILCLMRRHPEVQVFTRVEFKLSHTQQVGPLIAWRALRRPIHPGSPSGQNQSALPKRTGRSI